MLDKIKNEQEYYYALNRVEQLMYKVNPTSPEGEELEKLTKLVEEYENKQSVFIRGRSRVTSDDIVYGIKKNEI